MDILNTDFQLVAPPATITEGDFDGVPTDEKHVSHTPQGSHAARLRAFYLAEQAREGRNPLQSPGLESASGAAVEVWQADSYGKVGKIRALYKHTVILSQRTLKNYSRYVPVLGAARQRG
jgi:hypothetical protein